MNIKSFLTALIVVFMFCSVSAFAINEGEKIIVDNSNTQSFEANITATSTTGLSYGANGLKGSTNNYVYGANPTGQKAYAKFTPNIAVEGRYKVFVNIPLFDMGNSTDVLVQLYVNGNVVKETSINEADISMPNGFELYLGTYLLPTGTNTYVKMTNNLTAQNVYLRADAVVFQYTLLANDTPPIATEVKILGEYKSGQTLEGSYLYTDNESDIESGSTYRWFVATTKGSNLWKFVGSGKSYTITENDVGMYICFEVTPMSNQTPGTPQKSEVGGTIIGINNTTIIDDNARGESPGYADYGTTTSYTTYTANTTMPFGGLAKNVAFGGYKRITTYQGYARWTPSLPIGRYKVSMLCVMPSSSFSNNNKISIISSDKNGNAITTEKILSQSYSDGTKTYWRLDDALNYNAGEWVSFGEYDFTNDGRFYVQATKNSNNTTAMAVCAVKFEKVADFEMNPIFNISGEILRVDSTVNVKINAVNTEVTDKAFVGMVAVYNRYDPIKTVLKSVRILDLNIPKLTNSFSRSLTLENITAYDDIKCFILSDIQNIKPSIPSILEIDSGKDALLSAAPVFMDNMILQRDQNVSVWGTAASGRRVTVTYQSNNQQKTAQTIARNGKWSLELDKMSADLTGTLTVNDGVNSKVYNNVAVGEVWVMSGQSNVGPAGAGMDEVDYLGSVDYPSIRLFNQKLNSTTNNYDFTWTPCVGESSFAYYPAIAGYFARGIKKELETLGANVPVGIMMANQGGTKIEYWMPPVRPDNVDDKYYSLFNGNVNTNTWYNTLMKPIVPYNIRGFIWYQGEGNSNEGTNEGVLYRRLLPDFVSGLRKVWNNPNMTFLTVQVPNLDGFYANTVEGQMLAQRNIQNGAMVVSHDKTNFKTPYFLDYTQRPFVVNNADNLHPTHKIHIWQRLIKSAMTLCYGKNEEYMGPVYKSHIIDGNKIIVSFDHVGEGLVAQGTLNSFTICGADGVFLPATANIIDKDKIEIYNDNIASPYAARYYWYEYYPQMSLYNSAGLPASTFRADYLLENTVYDDKTQTVVVRNSANQPTTNWSFVENSASAYGSYTQLVGTGTTLKWYFDVATTGIYEVYMKWTVAADRQTDAKIDIKTNASTGYAGDSYTLTVDQTQNDDVWVKLGEYQLDAGFKNYVMITGKDGKTTCADAIRVIKK